MLISPATQSAIGAGLYNTISITSQNGECVAPLDVTTSACDFGAGKSRAYRGGGKTDWYLPSKDELAQLDIAYGSAMKNMVSSPTNFGLERSTYMSSTESSNSTIWGYSIVSNAWTRSFSSNVQKSANSRVRPIRAFAST
jgi:hypothetical protein